MATVRAVQFSESRLGKYIPQPARRQQAEMVYEDRETVSRILQQYPNAQIVRDDSGNIVEIQAGNPIQYSKNTRYPEQGMGYVYPERYVIKGEEIVEKHTQDVYEAGYQQRPFSTTVTYYTGGVPTSMTGFESRNQSVKQTYVKDLTTGESRDYGSAKYTSLDVGGKTSTQQRAESLGLQTSKVTGEKKTTTELKKEIKSYEKIAGKAVGQTKPSKLDIFRSQQPMTQVSVGGGRTLNLLYGTTLDVSKTPKSVLAAEPDTRRIIPTTPGEFSESLWKRMYPEDTRKLSSVGGMGVSEYALIPKSATLKGGFSRQLGSGVMQSESVSSGGSGRNIGVYGNVLVDSESKRLETEAISSVRTVKKIEAFFAPLKRDIEGVLKDIDVFASKVTGGGGGTEMTRPSRIGMFAQGFVRGTIGIPIYATQLAIETPTAIAKGMSLRKIRKYQENVGFTASPAPGQMAAREYLKEQYTTPYGLGEVGSMIVSAGLVKYKGGSSISITRTGKGVGVGIRLPETLKPSVTTFTSKSGRLQVAVVSGKSGGVGIKSTPLAVTSATRPTFALSKTVKATQLGGRININVVPISGQTTLTGRLANTELYRPTSQSELINRDIISGQPPVTVTGFELTQSTLRPVYLEPKDFRTKTKKYPKLIGIKRFQEISSTTQQKLIPSAKRFIVRDITTGEIRKIPESLIRVTGKGVFVKIDTKPKVTKEIITDPMQIARELEASGKINVMYSPSLRGASSGGIGINKNVGIDLIKFPQEPGKRAIEKPTIYIASRIQDDAIEVKDTIAHELTHLKQYTMKGIKASLFSPLSKINEILPYKYKLSEVQARKGGSTQKGLKLIKTTVEPSTVGGRYVEAERFEFIKEISPESRQFQRVAPLTNAPFTIFDITPQQTLKTEPVIIDLNKILVSKYPSVRKPTSKKDIDTTVYKLQKGGQILETAKITKYATLAELLVGTMTVSPKLTQAQVFTAAPRQTAKVSVSQTTLSTPQASMPSITLKQAVMPSTSYSRPLFARTFDSQLGIRTIGRGRGATLTSPEMRGFVSMDTTQGTLLSEAQSPITTEMQINIQKQIPSTIQSNVGVQDIFNTQRTEQTPASIFELYQEPISRQDNILQQTQVQISTQLLTQSLRLKQRATTGEEIIKIPRIPRIPKPIPSLAGLLTPLPPTRGGFSQQGYHTYVRQRGKFKRVTDKPVTKEAALGRGAEIADNYTQRSFRIRKTNSPATTREDLVSRWKALQYKFRPGARDKNLYVEKTKHAIDSFAEKQGIPYEAARLRRAGLLVVKRRRGSRRRTSGRFSGWF